jgi:hypothetical protein
MNDRSMTANMPQTAEKKKCGCGGACGCKGECRELECLIQPRFFCGQLLTDQDLSALLDWAKGKSALSRYRHGWGVVCGLDVRCHEPGHAGSVTVTPGYAIDCCGNDVVVCAEATIDLSTYCRGDANPCGDWDPKRKQTQQQTESTQTAHYGQWGLPKSEIVSVDLRLRYAESLSDAKSGLARGGCASTAVCEYTRTIEGHELCAVSAEDCEDLSSANAETWFEEYREGLRKTLQTLTSLDVAGEPERTVRRLLDWLSKHPPHHFCFIREWLCDVERSSRRSATWFRDVVFWILQDWRNHYLQCNCFGCGPDTSIPLARVWLWRRRDRDGKWQCTVLYINPHPPFRRPLSLECWPTPAGYINLAPFIWQRPEDVCVRLGGYGISDIRLEPFTFDDIDDLRSWFKKEQMSVQCADISHTQLVAYYVEDYCGHKRIVTFAGETRKSHYDTIGTRPSEPTSLDLKDIDGIGEGFEKRLHANGITDLRYLAAATPEKVGCAYHPISRSARPSSRRRRSCSTKEGCSVRAERRPSGVLPGAPAIVGAGSRAGADLPARARRAPQSRAPRAGNRTRPAHRVGRQRRADRRTRRGH